MFSAYLNKTAHTPLTIAACRNQIENVRNLLPTMDVNFRGVWGNTALHWAVANSNVNMILFLLEHASNLNVNIPEDSGKTALHMAIAKGWYHFDSGSGGPSKKDEPPQAVAIQALIERSEIDLQDKDGNTALHIAVMRRDLVAIESLLKRGANVDIKNNNGQTPVDVQKLSYFEVNNFLLRYVMVYSINKKIWDESSRSLATFFPLPTMDEIKDSPDDKPITTNGMHDLIEEKIIARFPIVFDQAIFLLEDLIRPLDAEFKMEDKPAEIITSASNMLLQLQKLKAQTIKEVSSYNLSMSEANALAKSVLILSLKTASLALSQQDIDNFKNDTSRHVKSSVLGQILCAIIGAVVGVFIGIMAGLVAGPAAAITGLMGGVKGAVIGASVGGVVGSGIGFWGGKSVMERGDCLKGMLVSAQKICRRI